MYEIWHVSLSLYSYTHESLRWQQECEVLVFVVLWFSLQSQNSNLDSSSKNGFQFRDFDCSIGLRLQRLWRPASLLLLEADSIFYSKTEPEGWIWRTPHPWLRGTWRCWLSEYHRAAVCCWSSPDTDGDCRLWCCCDSDWLGSVALGGAAVPCSLRNMFICTPTKYHDLRHMTTW